MGDTTGSDFAQALAVARDSGAPSSEQFKAAATLIAYGALETADPMLNRLEQNGVFVGRLRALSGQLRRSGILSEYRPLGDTSLLDAPPEILLRRADTGTDTLVVVFSGMEKRFYVSLQVLDRFLKPYGANVLYLADHSSCAYLNGLPGAAPGYSAMLDLIGRSAAMLQARRVFVLATSIGGFVGLRCAADLRAEAFLGLGIRTDFSLAARQSAGEMIRSLGKHCRDDAMLIDLRPYLAASQWPSKVHLIAGDSNESDAWQAERLRGLPRVELSFLNKYAEHDVVVGLVERGMFQDVLGGFMAGAPPGAAR
jgi:hypothetical protein